MKKGCHYLLFVFLLGLTSCATIIHSKHTHFTVYTKQPARIVVENDSLTTLGTEKTVVAKRCNKPVSITAYNDSLQKKVLVKPTLSPALLLNAGISGFALAGIAIDLATRQGFSYPPTVYLDLDDTGSTYFKYFPIPAPYGEYKYVFKATPLKLIALVNPALELTYERRTGRYFSTQFSAAGLLPISVWELAADVKPKRTGFSATVEEKLYFQKSAPYGPYVAMGFSFLNSRSHSVWNFGEADIFYDSTYNYTNYPDTFGINKQTTSIYLKLGYQFIQKRVVFDFYFGLGAKYRSVSHFDRITPEDDMEGTRHPNMFIIANGEANEWTVSIPLNFQVGMTF